MSKTRTLAVLVFDDVEVLISAGRSRSSPSLTDSPTCRPSTSSLWPKSRCGPASPIGSCVSSPSRGQYKAFIRLHPGRRESYGDCPSRACCSRWLCSSFSVGIAVRLRKRSRATAASDGAKGRRDWTFCKLVRPVRSCNRPGSSLGLAGGSQGTIATRSASGPMAVGNDSGVCCRCGLLVLMAEDHQPLSGNSGGSGRGLQRKRRGVRAG